MVSPKAKKDKIDGKKMFICDRHQKINLERERERLCCCKNKRERKREREGVYVAERTREREGYRDWQKVSLRELARK